MSDVGVFDIDHTPSPTDAAGDAVHLALTSPAHTDVLVTWDLQHLANAWIVCDGKGFVFGRTYVTRQANASAARSGRGRRRRSTAIPRRTGGLSHDSLNDFQAMKILPVPHTTVAGRDNLLRLGFLRLMSGGCPRGSAPRHDQTVDYGDPADSALKPQRG
ncbi:MAG: hypothetical protein AMXMBFR77_03200 [Phycisphaerales bacterium]|nr:MAG: hypothetical protein BroJett004_09410 [Planctomycetota bacterium]